MRKEIMEKPVFIINGFLDSGKTTFIKETLQDPQFLDGGKVLLILCEEGEEEYDEVAYAKRGIHIVSVEKEEQLTDEFLFGLEMFYQPHMIMIELNGMWKVENLLERNLPEEWALAQIITIADATTFEAYMKNMRSLMLEEMKYSDIAIINRCTDETNKTFIRRSIKPVNRKIQLIYEREDGIDDVPEEEELPYDIRAEHLDITDEDYGIWYMDAMDHPDAYEGKTVSFLAMSYVSSKLPKGCFVPGRMAMTCCADDIAFIGFLAKPPAAMNVKEMKSRQWYRVTAVMKKEYQREYQGEGPVLYVTSLVPAKEPADKLVYFN